MPRNERFIASFQYYVNGSDNYGQTDTAIDLKLVMHVIMHVYYISAKFQVATMFSNRDIVCSFQTLSMLILSTFPAEIGKTKEDRFKVLNLTFQNPLRNFKNYNHRRSYEFLKRSCKNNRKRRFSIFRRLYDVMMTSQAKTKVRS